MTPDFIGFLTGYGFAAFAILAGAWLGRVLK